MSQAVPALFAIDRAWGVQGSVVVARVVGPGLPGVGAQRPAAAGVRVAVTRSLDAGAIEVRLAIDPDATPGPRRLAIGDLVSVAFEVLARPAYGGVVGIGSDLI